MKIHITNLYNFNAGDELVKKQHRFADAGRELGFTEMGIFSYPVETDTPSELNKRLDGIIASLEFDDVVIMQLPTRNGYKYENLLFNKIKAYKAKVVLLLHNLQMVDDSNNDLQEKYFSLFRRSDAVIAPSSTASGLLNSNGVTNLLYCDKIVVAKTINVEAPTFLPKVSFYEKKLLMDAVETLFAHNMSQSESLLSSEELIQIGFGLHDKTGKYSMWVGTAMQSIIEHTSSTICFHILHDDTLCTDNINKLTAIAASQGHHIQFHLLDKTIFDSLIEQTSFFTIGTMFRIMLPELLPQLDKILYLDADLLVNRDIKELWNVDITNYALAAVPDYGSIHGHPFALPVRKNEVSVERYFNAGVLSINLSYFQKNRNMKNDVLQYLKENKDSIYPDQDALNSLYNNETLLLDTSWNYFALHVQKTGEKQLKNRIYHYAATRLMLYSMTEMDYHYYETLCRTPWGKEEGRRILNQAFERTVDHFTQLEKVIKKLEESPKKKIFYGPEDHVMRNIYQLLSIQNNDYRILMSPDENSNCILPCKCFSLLEKEQKGTFIVFVLPVADNGTALSNLENLGLENGSDFFVINRLMSPEKGGYV